MEKLVSTWYKNIHHMPESYIFPPETRPGNHAVPICRTIPVIDLLSKDAPLRILEASQEFGFFQVINHAVSKNLMNDAMKVMEEFFGMPAEEKESLYSDDPKRSCRLSTSFVYSGNYNTEDVHLWRDVLRHPCVPSEECIQSWPDKPTRYREVISECSIEVKKLALTILKMISEGLELGDDYFDDELSKNMTLSVNHYPPCPEPSLSLGLTKHCDPNLITILNQGDVNGLQVFKDGEWIGVEPIPNVFVVNIGYQLQIISNGRLKSAEHRAVTNSTKARTTMVYFINPEDNCIIEPAKALTNIQNPPIYRTCRYAEFMQHYFTNRGKTELVLEPFKIQS